MTFEGGAYLASGKFKCLFDNQDFVEYLRDDQGSKIGKMRCFRGKATIIAEKREFDSEQAFATTLAKTLSPALLRLAYATLALIPHKRYTLSSTGVERFKQVSKVSSQNCKALFEQPTNLQAVCMDQGIPLSGATIIQDLWTNVSNQPPNKVTMDTSVLLLTEYLCNICAGLKLLLDADILHGDIKANNVLLYPNPQPIRRYELPTDTADMKGGKPTDIVGRRLRYQVIDFGKHQTRTQFVKGGYRAFTRKSMRPWYNPLCLGVHLLHKESQELGERVLSESDSDSSKVRKEVVSEPMQEELQLWLPKLAQQMDKFAFMFILWQIAYSSNVQGSRSKAWDSTAFNASLFELIEACVKSPPFILEQALERVQEEAWVHKSDFRKYMLSRNFVWFATWDEIYAHVISWATKWLPSHTKLVIPKTLRSLVAFASPSLQVQPL